MSDYIHKTPVQQPGKQVTRRDLTDLAKKVEELSRQLSVEERPQVGERILSKTIDTNEDIALGVTVTNVKHGLGRAYQGWSLAGIDANAVVFEVTAGVDLTKYLPLQASATCNVKLRVW